ncbi:PAS domain S-box protein [Pseudomarimonas salicorniae]|uniref:histidine kinase n=1 Tax=Pseudomarimonas salicorniae TaxID=2933270 RepID=A0ABT0GEQ6_9GAMM|nr:PAS domain S-box protein [Lysobacter sp. CAU 1642]MCK7593032.1 PAS domain S-box protein [Lysobacter sp. CAU 1642]
MSGLDSASAMEPSLLAFVDLLPEPTLLVSVDGTVLASNRACAESLDLDSAGCRGRALAELVAEPADEVDHFLKLCARSRQLLPGALTLRGKVEAACKAEGGLLLAGEADRRPILMLRLLRRQEASSDFIALNLRVEELAHEIRRRREAEDQALELAERLRTTLASIGDAVITTDLESRVTNMNPVAEALTGWPGSEAVGRPLDEVFRVVDVGSGLMLENATLREGASVGLPQHAELVARDGSRRPIENSAAPIHDGEGKVAGFVLTFRDVTERRREESLLANQNSVLEQVVRGGDLGSVLDTLCLAIEQHVAGDTIATVLLVDEDGKQLRPAAGGRCPEEYSAAIDPVPIGPTMGSCGTAAHRGEPVLVEDIAVDPLWAEFRAVALPFGLRACSSVPIVSSAGEVLGTFAVYAAKPGRPNDQELRVMEFLARTAGIAIERRRSEQALRESELRYRLVGEAANDAIWDWNLLTNEVIWNEGLQVRFGHPTASVGPEAGWWVDHIHPDDRDRVVRDIHAVIDSGGTAWHDEYRFRCADGTYAEVYDRARVVRDEAGRAVRMVGSMLDLTERKRAEESLRFQLDLTKSITDTATTAIFMMDAKSRCTFMNPAAEEMTGYRFEEVENGILHDFIHHHHPDGRPYPMPECPIDRALPENGEVRDHEDVFIRKNGEYFPVLVNAQVIYKQGEAVGTVIEVQDITVRKRAEEALRESEAHFRNMADNAPVMMWVSDATGHCTYLSSRWYQYTGRPVGSDVGFGWLDAVHPDDVPGARAIFLEANRAHQPFNIDYRLRRHDGDYRWAVNAAMPRFNSDGVFQGFVGTVSDVHERKVEEQGSQFLAGASAVLAELTDPDSTLMRLADIAVPQFADWCAVDLVVGEGKTRRLTLRHADPERERIGRAMYERYPPAAEDPAGVPAVVRTGRSELVEDIPGALLQTVAQDAEHLAMMRELQLRSYMCVPMSVRGRLLGVLTFVVGDESARKYDVRDLRVAEDVAQRAAVAIDNASLYRALRDTDRRKDEFLATLAHELRNPLAPIRNGLQLIRLAGGDWSTVEQAHKLMDRQLNQMVRLVDDLMDVSRISTGKLQLRVERVALATVLQSAIESSRPLIQQMGHELSVDMPERPIMLEVDPTRMAQVFLNLLNNAAKYSEPHSRIWVRAEQEQDEAVISVRDAGIGIDSEQLPRVFDMFSQVERSLEKSQGGLGIGLNLVKRLVDLHGGRIEARSAGLGQGAEFIVRVPVLVEPAEETPATESPGEDASALRILVVDDNRDGADSLALMLRMMGNQLCTAYDGEEAVEAAARFEPDVILLDIGLPKLNGYEACRRIRATEAGRDMVIIAQTGWGQEEDRQRTREAGFDHHLVKPVDSQELLKLLGSLPELRTTR